jgi:hypothetical protein
VPLCDFSGEVAVYVWFLNEDDVNVVRICLIKGNVMSFGLASCIELEY